MTSFIDREAKFTWIDRPRDDPGKAVGFDFDGAAAHFLDVGGIPVAESMRILDLFYLAYAKIKTEQKTAAERLNATRA